MRLDVASESTAAHVIGTSSASPVGRWILTVAAFLIPLSFLPTAVSEFVLPKLLLGRLLVMVLAVVLVASWLRNGAVTWMRSALDPPLLAFVASAAISSIFAINHNLAVFGPYSRWEGLLTVTTYALLFWLAVQLISGEGDAAWLIWSLLLSGYVMAVVAVLQSAFGVLGGGYFQGSTYIRADATMAHPDFLGVFLAMLLPVAFSKLISQKSGLDRLVAGNFFVVLSAALLAPLPRTRV